MNTALGTEGAAARTGWAAAMALAATTVSARNVAMIVFRSFADPAANLHTNRADFDRSLLWGIVDVRSVQTLGQGL